MSRMKKTTTNATDIIYRRSFESKPEMIALLEEERLHADIARQIRDLRTEAGLTQRELARQVGTTASVICRLESAEYNGHSLSMLQRIAAALNRRVEVQLIPCSLCADEPEQTGLIKHQ
jgi:ribosome-binding protein aMBF1 (putative translation factor)